MASSALEDDQVRGAWEWNEIFYLKLANLGTINWGFNLSRYVVMDEYFFPKVV